MKLFISWSGPLSQQVAEALRDWIPKVIQTVKPWMSSADIGSGARWSGEIQKQLEATKAGVVCMTKQNLTAPWLMFEAGALSKTIDSSFVCPYLFQVEPTDLQGPLAAFQARRADKADTLKLLNTIHAASQTELDQGSLAETFELWWPKLAARLSAISMPDTPATPVRNERELLEEILEIVRVLARQPDIRSLDKVSRDFQDALAKDVVRYYMRASPDLRVANLWQYADRPAEQGLLDMLGNVEEERRPAGGEDSAEPDDSAE